MCMLTFRERRMGVERKAREDKSQERKPRAREQKFPSLPAGGASRLYYFEEHVL